VHLLAVDFEGVILLLCYRSRGGVRSGIARRDFEKDFEKVPGAARGNLTNAKQKEALSQKFRTASSRFRFEMRACHPRSGLREWFVVGGKSTSTYHAGRVDGRLELLHREGHQGFRATLAALLFEERREREGWCV